MTSTSRITVLVGSAAWATLVAGLSFAQSGDQPSLLKAAAFVLSGYENMEPRGNRILVKSDVGLMINATEDPCIVQRRESFAPYRFKQINFRKVRDFQVFVPSGAHFTQLRLSGDKGIYCEGELNPTMVKDPHFMLTDRGCQDWLDIRQPDVGDIQRAARAVAYISQNFCPYGGKPY